MADVPEKDFAAVDANVLTFADSGGSASSLLTVKTSMRDTGYDNEIFDPVISAISIDVMNMLMSKQRTTNVCGHDAAMFVIYLSSNGGGNIGSMFSTAKKKAMRLIASTIAEFFAPRRSDFLAALQAVHTKY